MAKQIPLVEIERSIRINNLIDRKANKVLQLKKGKGLNNQGIARCIFIYLALKTKHNGEEICDYLKISNGEYSAKVGLLTDLYEQGKILFESGEQNAPIRGEGVDINLFFYRKLVLAQNYLRYRFSI